MNDICFVLIPLLLLDVRFKTILSFSIGRLQQEEALKVRVAKASEVSGREKVMCFHRNAFFVSVATAM